MNGDMVFTSVTMIIKEPKYIHTYIHTYIYFYISTSHIFYLLLHTEN